MEGTERQRRDIGGNEGRWGSSNKRSGTASESNAINKSKEGIRAGHGSDGSRDRA
jgi:hypothetical protein